MIDPRQRFAWPLRWQSLRTQLVFWNILALGLLFGVLGVVIRYTVTSTIFASIDHELETRTQRPPPPPDNGPPPDQQQPPDGQQQPPDGQQQPPDGQQQPPSGYPMPQGGQQQPSQDGQQQPPPQDDQQLVPGAQLPPGYPQPQGGPQQTPGDNQQPSDNQEPPGDQPPPDNQPPPGYPGPDNTEGLPRYRRQSFGQRGFGNGRFPAGQNPYRPRMFDLNGQPLGFDTSAPWDEKTIAPAAHGEKVFSIVTVDGAPLRVISRPFPPRGPIRGVVQDAYPMAGVYQSIAGLNRALLMLIPVGLLFAGLAGTYLTNRVLQRVRLMTSAAAQMSASDFGKRLPVIGNDEFSELSETFNGLLWRLDTAYQRQKRLMEQQQRFTADASHELKTPLTIIKGNTSMVLGSHPTVESYRQSLQEIDTAAETMSVLVQDLLLLARSDSGQLGRAPIELLAREVLERAISRLSSQRDVPITLNIADESLSILGNEDELVRLFANLIDNAVRYTPAAGKVQVTALRSFGIATIQIADNGIGIAAEHLPHLGERFYRIDSSRARIDGGTGLGLSICKSIVEAHQGRLTFESTPAKGTTVTVTLPSTG